MDYLATRTARLERETGAATFARIAKAWGATGGTLEDGARRFRREHPRTRFADAERKAAQAAATTGETWGGGLSDGGLGADFLAAALPGTVLGRLPLAREVPLHARLPALTQTPRGSWVGEGRPLRVVNAGIDLPALDRRTLGLIVVATTDLLEAGGEVAARLFERLLTDALTAALDASLLDPALTETPGESPASLTHGAPSETPASGSAADVVGAVDAALGHLTGALGGLAFAAAPATALALARLRWPDGSRAFPDARRAGGSLYGAPLLTAPAAPAGTLVALDAERIVYALDDMDLTLSEAATLQLSDEPTDGAADVVSLWQSNSRGFRGVVSANWRTLDAGAVAVVQGIGG